VSPLGFGGRVELAARPHFVYGRNVAEPPDIASIAALIGDPARARMLMALMGGRALTASELALEAEVAPSTASAHLAKLEAKALVRAERQGRHRYFRIGDEQVADVVERLCGLSQTGPSRVKTGPKDPAMRKARVCYDHLAGEIAVDLFEGLVAQKWLVLEGEGVSMSDAGRRHFADFGVDVAALDRERRVACRLCLDWSVRRHHLAGGLGAALLAKIYARRWARPDPVSRTVHFSPAGLRKLEERFGMATR